MPHQAPRPPSPNLHDSEGFVLGPHAGFGPDHPCRCQLCRQGVILPSPSQIARDERLLTVWGDVMASITRHEQGFA